MKTTLRNLAKTFLETENDAVATSCRAAALAILRNVDGDQSPSALCQQLGFSYFLGVNSSAKTIKGTKLSYDTLSLYLIPTSGSGANFCASASLGCKLACLVNAGRIRMEGAAGSIRISRLLKTWLITARMDIAVKLIEHDIKKAQSKKRKFCVRLNGTSDINWLKVSANFPTVQFYDYTKVLSRALRPTQNQHVTFSYAEDNWQDCRKAYRAGLNIAIPVVARDHAEILALPGTYEIDSTDLRFLDSEYAPGQRFGILSAKLSDGLQDGIKAGFIADIAMVKAFIAYVTD
jgi:hypothetical protein